MAVQPTYSVCSGEGDRDLFFYKILGLLFYTLFFIWSRPLATGTKRRGTSSIRQLQVHSINTLPKYPGSRLPLSSVKVGEGLGPHLFSAIKSKSH